MFGHYVFVADHNLIRIVVFTKDGKYITTLVAMDYCTLITMEWCFAVYLMVIILIFISLT